MENDEARFSGASEFSRRKFLKGTGHLGMAALVAPWVGNLEAASAEKPTASESGYEFAAGEVVLPFEYTAKRSFAPRPESLDFLHQVSPDNCQVFVRIDGELWEFRSQWVINLGTVARYKGPDIDHLVKVADGVYPAGMSSCWFLGGMWYDEAEHKLYAPMHVEADGPRRAYPFCRKIALATSTDKGASWRYEGDIITSETYYYTHEFFKFSGSSYGIGLADFGFYVDQRGGYFYIFPDEGWAPFATRAIRWNSRAARCRISDKMAPGKWQNFYNGGWDEPALGGKSSTVAPSHLWGVVYSTVLERYICMFLGNQDPPNPPNVDGVQIGSCTDLEKQDWVWGHCPEAMFGFMNLINAEGTDVASTCADSFRFYSYFNGNTFQRLDLKVSRGQKIIPGLQPRYLFEPHPESSDPMLGRVTKIVGSASAEMKYAGTWKDHDAAASYEGKSKESASANSSVEFSFEGPDIYWRALRSPESGNADVYIDGVLRKTIDCYSPRGSTYEQFMYIKKGLAPDTRHTVKVVVTGKKHAKSASALITHIAFEFSAESYRASAGFSACAGKNNWFYQQGEKSGESVDLDYVVDESRPQFYWSGKDGCRIGRDYQIPGDTAAIRKWTAPHGGMVRIEGVLNGQGDLSASIWLNREQLWPSEVTSNNSSHDLSATVLQGDSLSFVFENNAASKSADKKGQKVFWDPVITYTKSILAVWKPAPASGQDLALNKYARSKVLVSSYRPFDAVDGDLNTNFTLHADDKLSAGDDWLQVDLENPFLIDHYVVASQAADPAYRPKVFSLQKSDDGFAWTEVDSVTDNNPSVAHHYGIPMTRVARAVTAFPARFVRLYLPQGKPFTISAFELYYTDGKNSFAPPIPAG